MNFIKFFLLLLTTGTMTLSLYGQQYNRKINPAFIYTLDKMEREGELDKNLSFLVKGNLEQIESFATAHDGKIHTAFKGIATITLPAGKIPVLERQDFVQRMEYEPFKAHALGDFVAVNNGIDSVWNGFGPLPAGYEGEDVIVGMIDLGLDWRNHEFQNADSTTRIISIWDQNVTDSSNMQSSFGYGYEWDSQAIDAGMINHVVTQAGGHGTMATGIATGNGQVADTLAGVAPKSDIIHVRVGFNDFTAKFIDALNYILDIAEQQGKPVAINSSVGSYFGAHDQRGLANDLIGNLLDAAAGRILVQAVGNAGQARYHLEYDITADTSVTWFKHSNAVNAGYINMYADKANFENAYVAFGLISSTDFKRKGRTVFINIPTDYSLVDGQTLQNNYEVLDSMGNSIGTINGIVQLYDGVYDMTFLGATADNSDYWELFTTGSGHFDSWNSEGLIGNSNIINSMIPSPDIFPDSIHYKYPDNRKTLLSGWACSDKVLTVGSYYNRPGYLDLNLNYQTEPGTPQSHYTTASRGPTRDNRTKPNVNTSGQRVFTTNYLSRLAVISNDNPEWMLFTGHHIRFGGTSAAAPIATGAAALYLEMHPQANYAEIINAFESTAKVDSFVLNSQYAEGMVPNPDWGYGKLNLYQAMVTNLIYGCTDTAAVNYDPFVDIAVEDSCVYPIVNVLDLEQNNYFTIHPNPFSNETQVTFALPQGEAGVFYIYNNTGQIIRQLPVKETKGSINLSMTHYPKGLYWCLFKTGSGLSQARKMILH